MYRATQWFKRYARELALNDPTMQTIDYTVMQRWLWHPDYHPLPLKSILGTKLPQSRMLRLPIPEICALAPKNLHLYQAKDSGDRRRTKGVVMADEQVKLQARETDAAADSNVVAVYQRQVELVTKAWGRCTVDALLLVATGLVLVFAPHATFIRPTRHAIWLMPLLLYVVITFTSQRMLTLRMKELEEIHSMVASEAALKFTVPSRAAWSVQASTATATAFIVYVTLWFCGMSIP
jgi:hypothetical protein